VRFRTRKALPSNKDDAATYGDMADFLGAVDLGERSGKEQFEMDDEMEGGEDEEMRGAS